MSSISVLPHGSTIPVEVEIIDFFTCGGIRCASVEAVHGKPFVGGNKWSVWTPFTTVKVSDLIIEPDECHCCLPEQSCPACKAAARRAYGLEFEEASK